MDLAPPVKATYPMKLQNCSNPNPRFPTRCSRSEERDDLCSKYEDIDAEDTVATTSCGLQAVMDSAPAPKSSDPAKLEEVSNLNPRFPTRHSRSGGGDDPDSKNEDIDANDAGAMTPCGWPAAMDSSPALKATPPKKPGVIQIQIQDFKQIFKFWMRRCVGF